MKGIQVGSNKGPALFQGEIIRNCENGFAGFEYVKMERPYLFTLGGNNKIAKVLSRNLKIFSS